MKIYCHGRPVALQCMDLNMVNREYPNLPKHRLKPNLCKPVFNEDHQSRVYLLRLLRSETRNSHYPISFSR
jgi:hypothetical protein